MDLTLAFKNNDQMCVVCMDNLADLTFEKCKHCVLCKFCATQIIAQNDLKCPQCMETSEKVLCSENVNYFESIDFPIYFVLLKHIDEIRNKNNNDDDVIKMATQYFEELQNVFPIIKYFPKKYVFFSRSKFVIKNEILIINKEKQLVFPSKILIKFNSFIKDFSKDFIYEMIELVKIENEKKQKEINSKRDSLLAVIYQIEEHTKRMKSPLKEKIKDVYLKTIAAESVPDENLDTEIATYSQNLSFASLISNITYNNTYPNSENESVSLFKNLFDYVKQKITNDVKITNISTKKINYAIRGMISIIEMI
jgi:hypothetical protein